MNPPVRDASHRAGIWRGIEQGIVDVLGSGHAPHTREEKDQGLSGHAAGRSGPSCEGIA
jgi:dihydroorotase